MKTVYSPYERAMQRKPTADERAQAKREAAFRHLCWAIRDAIEALPREEASFTQVPMFFGTRAGKTPDARYAVFRELDERHGYYGYGRDTHWHSLLRSCRNHPVHGPRLFDFINNRLPSPSKGVSK